MARRVTIDPGQHAFSFDVPPPARAEADLAGLDQQVAATVARMLKDDPRSRAEIAAAMSSLLGVQVPPSMLDAYASQARENYSISFGRMLALTAVTDRHDLLNSLTRRIGASLLVGDEVLTAELGHIKKSMAKLRERERAILSIAPTLGGADA